MRLAGDSPETVESNRVLIARQVKQLVRLVDDLLDIARISFGSIRLQREPVEISRIVSLAVESTRPLIEGGCHCITVTLPEEPIVVSVDNGRMVQVLQNLLQNAVENMDSGGSIWLSVEHSDGEVLLRVKDTGTGIPSDMLHEVFEMFAQVNQSHERSLGRLGIGMSLVKTLVQLHGGTVEVFSAGPGLGSEYCVRLPLPASSEHPCL